MKNKQPRRGRSRFLRWLNVPTALGLLAIAQTAILLLLLFTLLKSPDRITEVANSNEPTALSIFMKYT